MSEQWQDQQIDIITTETLSALRARVSREQHVAMKERIQTNPKKMIIEQALGVYLDELDPQVRDAVIAMNEKGYKTTSSGFWGTDHHQHTEGPFTVNDAVKHQLTDLGVRTTEFVLDDQITTAFDFPSNPPDLDALKDKWDQVANILPKT